MGELLKATFFVELQELIESKMKNSKAFFKLKARLDFIACFFQI
jgi:hypothetical protein